MALKTSFKTARMVFLACALMSLIICSYRGSAMPDKVCDTRDGASLIAEQFIKNDETFRFDGMADTLSLRVEHAGTLSDVVNPRFSALTLQLARPLAPPNTRSRRSSTAATAATGTGRASTWPRSSRP